MLKAVDEFIPEPVRHTELPFMMSIEDVFSIKGRGTVVTGRVDRGIVKVGDALEIVGLHETKTTVCTGVEMFHKLLDQGQAGDNLGVLLRGIEREQVERGQVLAKPGSITPHTKFKSEVYVLKKEEGGRHKAFFTGYRPQFFIRTMDVTGNLTLPEGVEMVMPGDNVNLNVELIVPVALEKGSKFAIREGGLTVGAGVITEIIELKGDSAGITRGVRISNGKIEGCPAGDHAGLLRLQGAQLHDPEEPAQRPGPARNQEVLPALPQAHGAQRRQVGARSPARTRRGRTAASPCGTPRRAPTQASSSIWQSTALQKRGLWVQFLPGLPDVRVDGSARKDATQAVRPAGRSISPPRQRG